VPDLDDGLIEKITAQSDEQSGHRSITELELRRDNNLVAILRALKKTNSGAGKLINAMDARLERETNRH
jgi:carnitine 3-dehydrogenase